MTTNTEQNREIAQTIIAQLGGGMFIAMTGAKNIFFGDRNVTMKIGTGTTNKMTHLRITLDGSDTYTMEFLRVRGGRNPSCKTLCEIPGCFDVDLQRIFRRETGFDTRL